MRNRGSAVLIDNNKVALIKRVRNNKVYYVFPGGGIEEGETPEQATIREAYEELGVTISISERFAELEYKGKQFYFLALILSGKFGSGEGEEFQGMDNERGTYEPMWVHVQDLLSINVKPKEVAKQVVTYVREQNFR